MAVEMEIARLLHEEPGESLTWGECILLAKQILQLPGVSLIIDRADKYADLMR